MLGGRALQVEKAVSAKALGGSKFLVLAEQQEGPCVWSRVSCGEDDRR